MNTVLFLNATIGFSENCFLVLVSVVITTNSLPLPLLIPYKIFAKRNYRVLNRVFVCVRMYMCVCFHVCFCMITRKEIDLGT